MSAVVTWLAWNTGLAGALALAAWFVHRRLQRPAFAHVLWLLALVRLAAPPLVDVPLPGWPRAEPTAAQDDTRTVVPTALDVALPPGVDQLERVVRPGSLAPAQRERASTAEPTAAVASTPTTWGALPWLGLWAACALAFLLRHGRRIARFERLLRTAEPAPPALVARTRRLARAMGRGHAPELCLVGAEVSPHLFGAWGRARIVLPARLLGTLTGRQRDALLLHELAHWRRRDHWVRHLELVVSAFFFWHPLTHVVRRGLRESEEQCCDAWVTALLPRERRTYATALVDTLEFLSGRSTALPILASGATSLPLLQRRLHMILHRSVRPANGRRMRVLLGALGLALLPIGPGLSQSRRAAQEPETILETVLQTGQVLRVRHGDVDLEIRPTGDGNVRVVATRRRAGDDASAPVLAFPPASGAPAAPHPGPSGPAGRGGATPPSPDVPGAGPRASGGGVAPSVGGRRSGGGAGMGGRFPGAGPAPGASGAGGAGGGLRGTLAPSGASRLGSGRTGQLPGVTGPSGAGSSRRAVPNLAPPVPPAPPAPGAPAAPSRARRLVPPAETGPTPAGEIMVRDATSRRTR